MHDVNSAYLFKKSITTTTSYRNCLSTI